MSMSKAGDAKSRELIQTVSQISNGLMNEVSKVIIGKQENLRSCLLYTSPSPRDA